MPKKKHRSESDSLGRVDVPEEAYYEAQTQRAIDSYPVSGVVFPITCVRAMAYVKMLAAGVHRDMGLLEDRLAEAIMEAARDVLDGKLAGQFPVDVFQTGSATASNMNVNEVIASRANEILTGHRGGKDPVHPNDHVNLGQSTNDVAPTALRIALAIKIRNHLLPSLEGLHQALSDKSKEFALLIKTGRTHFMDGVPMKLSDDFNAWARQVELSKQRVIQASQGLLELPLGGTAVGNALNAPAGAAEKIVQALAENARLPFVVAADRLEAQFCRDAEVYLSGALKSTALSLGKIASDIRFFASGPRCGIGELELPAMAPGSSFMPGKINPVMCETMLQTTAQVVGCDAAVSAASQIGGLELAVHLPVMAHNLMWSIKILSNASRLFAKNCVQGIIPNRERLQQNAENTTALATVMAPVVGYDQAAALAKEAFSQNKTVKELAVEKGLVTADEWEEILKRELKIEEKGEED